MCSLRAYYYNGEEQQGSQSLIKDTMDTQYFNGTLGQSPPLLIASIIKPIMYQSTKSDAFSVEIQFLYS